MQSDDQFIAASIGDTEWLQQSVYKGTVKYDKNVSLCNFKKLKSVHCLNYSIYLLVEDFS